MMFSCEEIIFLYHNIEKNDENVHKKIVKLKNSKFNIYGITNFLLKI